jgi:hypothetical protein
MKKKGFILVIALFAVLSVLTFAPTNVSAATKIPSDAFEYGGHSYYLYQTSSYITWTDAKKACEKVGGHLVTLTSKKENDAVCKYMKNQWENAWIGLYNSGSNSNQVWVWENGEESDYMNWAEYQPGNNTFDYNYVWLGYDDSEGWRTDTNDCSGYGIVCYICEWDYVPLEVAETTVRLDKGDSTMLDVVAKKAGKVVSNPKITYKSSNTDVAKVSSKGKVVAVAPGTCKITVKYKGATQKVTVLVNAKK